MSRKVKVGLMGLGTVGTGVVRLIEGNREEYLNQTGVEIEIRRILVRNKNKKRDVYVDPEILTENPDDLIYDDEIDVIIEVMGGIESTKDTLLKAIEQGKHIVTANKDLMALHGIELIKKAGEHGCDIYYEASVAGGIPIINAITEGLTSDRITKIMGIVNGTTNYILTKMTMEQASFEEVLREAQELGYAEADPTSDVEGLDAARKMVILASLGFHAGVDLEDVSVKGISEVTLEDIRYAKQLGYTMKLIGIAKKDDGAIEVSVEPTLIRDSHPLASVNGVFNAVYVYGEAVGETMFYGPGAGELPTATAVVSDLLNIVKNIQLGVNGKYMAVPYKPKKLKSDKEIFAKYFIRLIVNDQSGVLAQIAKLMAEENISVEKVLQEPYHEKTKAELILVTHKTSKKSVENILEELKQLDVIKEIKSCYRVEGGE